MKTVLFAILVVLTFTSSTAAEEKTNPGTTGVCQNVSTGGAFLRQYCLDLKRGWAAGQKSVKYNSLSEAVEALLSERERIVRAMALSCAHVDDNDRRDNSRCGTRESAYQYSRLNLIERELNEINSAEARKRKTVRELLRK